MIGALTLDRRYACRECFGTVRQGEFLLARAALLGALIGRWAVAKGRLPCRVALDPAQILEIVAIALCGCQVWLLGTLGSSIPCCRGWNRRNLSVPLRVALTCLRHGSTGDCDRRGRSSGLELAAITGKTGGFSSSGQRARVTIIAMRSVPSAAFWLRSFCIVP